MQKINYSEEFIKDILKHCGNFSDAGLYRKLLTYSGSISKCFKILYLIVNLELDIEESKRLKKILPKSKNDKQNIIIEIIKEYKQDKVKHITVKDILKFLESKYPETERNNNRIIEEPITLELLLEHGMPLPQAIRHVIKRNSGSPAKYSFKCKLCGHDRNTGRFYKSGGSQFEVCSFCLNRNSSFKLIYTPMGNRR